jgi:hypothetical protein
MMAYYSLVNVNRMYKKPITVFFILLTTALIRYPFVILIGVRLLIKGNQVKIKRLIFLVVTLLIYNGYRLSTTDFGANFELNRSPGISMDVFTYNQYYLGSLIMAPAKIFANFYDLILSIFTPTENGRYNLYTISCIPLAIAFLLQYRSIISIIRYPISALRGPLGPLLAFVIIFLTLISGNIYIHARYLWPIMPLLILILIGIREKAKEYKHHSVD